MKIFKRFKLIISKYKSKSKIILDDKNKDKQQKNNIN